MDAARDATMDQATNQDSSQWTFGLFNSAPIGMPLPCEDFSNDSNPIFPEELPTMHAEIRQTAEKIFNNWETLRAIVERHENTIQRRWTKKSMTKRRELLLTIWPNMAADHRPDISLQNKWFGLADMKKESKAVLQGRSKQQKMCEGSQREALLMPYINVEDLTKTEPLLLMINARAHREPHEFAKRDLQLSTHHTHMTDWRSLEGYVMDFDGPHHVPAAYGELRHGEWQPVFASTGADPRLAGGAICSGDGLWILEIQDRIYKFLLDIARKVLHDIPSGDLIGPKYGIQPQLPLPSANTREDGVTSLASTNLEAIYSSPGRMDLHRIQLLVTAKANEEDDKVWALREDPWRFSEGVADFIAHQPQYVSDLSGAQHPTTNANEFQKRCGYTKNNLKDHLAMKFLLESCMEAEFWGNVLQDITELIAIKEKHFDGKDIKSTDPLPEPFAMALQSVQAFLCFCVEFRVRILRWKAYSSPPLRPYMRRNSPDTLENFVRKADKHPPRHIFEFLVILARLCCYRCIVSSGHISGVQSLLETYDKFMDTVPDSHLAVNSYVAEEISTLALLSEFLRQIHLFQPWAATSHKEMATPHVQAAMLTFLGKRFTNTTPLKDLKYSSKVLSMPVEIAEIPYPVHKRRTAANVNAMQKAEALLDKMWDAILREMEQQNLLPPHIENVLLRQGRQLQRTPDWVEPVDFNKNTTPQVAPQEVLVSPFRGLNIDDNNKVQDYPVEKTKIKTRGNAAPQIPDPTEAQETEQAEDLSPAHTILVDRRALRVFSTLFHTPSSTSQPGEVPWKDFLHAMRSAGFGMEKLYGSVWQFTPPCDSDGGMAADVKSILFHEPHPHSRIPFRSARRHGRRLARTYGWSGETFVAK